MRITQNMLADSTLRNLNRTMEKLDRLQDQLTSGQRITAPSDDPIGAAMAVELRGTLKEIEQNIRNVDAAKSWLEASDFALESMTRILHRARELSSQGASDVYSSVDKQNMAVELTTLIDQAISQANSTYAGQYLFSGYKVNTPPFSILAGSGGTIVYSGDSGEIRRQIDTQSTITVNIPGGTALSQALTGLVAVRDALNSGQSSDIATTIDVVDGSIDAILGLRSQAGARVNRLTDQGERLESLKVNLAELLSKTQDVDMTESISDYATQQNVYQAALAAGAKAIQPSLLDYLR